MGQNIPTNNSWLSMLGSILLLGKHQLSACSWKCLWIIGFRSQRCMSPSSSIKPWSWSRKEPTFSFAKISGYSCLKCLTGGPVDHRTLSIFSYLQGFGKSEENPWHTHSAHLSPFNFDCLVWSHVILLRKSTPIFFIQTFGPLVLLVE